MLLEMHVFVRANVSLGARLEFVKYGGLVFAVKSIFNTLRSTDLVQVKMLPRTGEP